MPPNETKSELAKLEKAPQAAEGDSVKQSGDPERRLLLDLFYHDYRRVALFLAQLETYGLLQQVKATEAVSHIGTESTTKSAGAGIASLLKGEMSHGEIATDDEKDAAERTYDPLYANARRFMDYLAGTSLVESKIARARIGQFVHVYGVLTIIDTELLRNLWQSPIIIGELQKRWKTGQHPGQPKLTKEKVQQQQMMFEMLPKWPHGVQMTIDGQGFSTWGTLAKDCLITAASDLALKHGYEIPGTWHILGILDAMPGPVQAYIPVPEIVSSPEEAMQNMKSLAKNFSTNIRGALGRPPDKYGITPILIFREVSG
jgi:hypothetical protein